MSFTTRTIVRFAHVDAAGIVFYPRYFEMLNAVVEDYFALEVGVDFATMHRDRRLGVPTVKLDSEFLAVSRLGDLLDFRLAVEQVGRSSAEFRIEGHCAGQLRVRARIILVCIDLDNNRSVTWPADMRPNPEAQAA